MSHSCLRQSLPLVVLCLAGCHTMLQFDPARDTGPSDASPANPDRRGLGEWRPDLPQPADAQREAQPDRAVTDLRPADLMGVDHPAPDLVPPDLPAPDLPSTYPDVSSFDLPRTEPWVSPCVTLANNKPQLISAHQGPAVDPSIAPYQDGFAVAYSEVGNIRLAGVAFSSTAPHIPVTMSSSGEHRAPWLIPLGDGLALSWHYHPVIGECLADIHYAEIMNWPGVSNSCAVRPSQGWGYGPTTMFQPSTNDGALSRPVILSPRDGWLQDSAQSCTLASKKLQAMEVPATCAASTNGYTAFSGKELNTYHPRIEPTADLSRPYLLLRQRGEGPTEPPLEVETRYLWLDNPQLAGLLTTVSSGSSNLPADTVLPGSPGPFDRPAMVATPDGVIVAYPVTIANSGLLQLALLTPPTTSTPAGAVVNLFSLPGRQPFLARDSVSGKVALVYVDPTAPTSIRIGLVDPANKSLGPSYLVQAENVVGAPVVAASTSGKGFGVAWVGLAPMTADAGTLGPASTEVFFKLANCY